MMLPMYRRQDIRLIVQMMHCGLFPTVYKYVSETGNVAFMDEVIPFANKDEGNRI